MKRKLFGAISAAAVLMGGTSAYAQSAASADELADLRERVAELEAANAVAGRPAGAPRLSFNVGESTTVQVYGFVRFEAFYDFDFDQGDLSNVGAVGNPANATDGEFNTSVRVSRFGIRSTTGTDIGTIGTQLEFDLSGPVETKADRQTCACVTPMSRSMTIGPSARPGRTLYRSGNTRRPRTSTDRLVLRSRVYRRFVTATRRQEV